MEKPNLRPSYAQIVTMIALMLFGVFWAKIDSQLTALDVRLRCVEQQIAAISVRLNIASASSTEHYNRPGGAAIASPVDER